MVEIRVCCFACLSVLSVCLVCLSCLSVLSVCLSLSLLSVCPSVRLSVRLSVCPSVRPSVRPSVCPSVRLSVRPSVGLSVTNTSNIVCCPVFHYDPPSVSPGRFARSLRRARIRGGHPGQDVPSRNRQKRHADLIAKGCHRRLRRNPPSSDFQAPPSPPPPPSRRQWRQPAPHVVKGHGGRGRRRRSREGGRVPQEKEA